MVEEIRAKKGKGSPVLALFALYARSSFRKILVVFAGMVIAEGTLFYRGCRLLEQSGGVVGPEKMIDLCFFKYIFLAALVLVAFILGVTEGDRGGCKSSYTLLRLRVSRKQQFAVKTVYNFLCLMLVFAVQILTALVVCRIYETRLPSELLSPQYLFLIFYRNEFLHCILPMADVGKWACVLLLLLALAMDAAYVWNRNGDGSRNKNGNGSVGGFGRKRGVDGNVRNGVLLSITHFCILPQWFVSEINSPLTLLCVLYCIAIIVVVLLRLLQSRDGN